MVEAKVRQEEEMKFAGIRSRLEEAIASAVKAWLKMRRKNNPCPYRGRQLR